MRLSVSMTIFVRVETGNDSDAIRRILGKRWNGSGARALQED